MSETSIIVLAYLANAHLDKAISALKNNNTNEVLLEVNSVNDLLSAARTNMTSTNMTSTNMMTGTS
jgi:hypothetical protein